MTKEQIKQNAEKYAEDKDYRTCNPTYWAEIDFIAGAHSRDEEIRELLEKFTYEIDSLIAQKEDLQEELNKLRDHWHKASEELPPISEPCEESADCVLAVLGREVKIGGKIYLTGYYDHRMRDWIIYGNGYSKMTNLEVIDWMLLNKTKS